jgi:hypothetical protein
VVSGEAKASQQPLHLHNLLAIVFVAVAATVAEAQSAPVAFPVAEPSFPAQLANIDREWNVSFKAGGKVRVVAAADLAYWGRYRDAEAGPQIVLADGGVIHADLLLLDDNRLVVGDATGLGRGLWDESALPRDALRAIILQPPAAAVERDPLLIELAAYNKADDRLLLDGGETVSGTVIAMPSAGRFAPEGGQVDPSITIVRRGNTEPLIVPAGKVIAVSFGAAEPQRAESGRRVTAWLGLADGSLVRAASIQVRGDVVSLVLSAGGELKTTLAGRDDPDKRFWDAVTCIEPSSPRVGWLSGLPSLGFKHIPFLSVERPLGLDRSALGTRLRAGGTVFRKGLGMPSASRVAYETTGYGRFEAELAIDDAAGLSGSAIFKVVLETRPGEWQTAYESPVLRGGDAPVPISIDLKNATRLALLVDFADHGDVCDYADWLMARLIK